MPMVLIFISFFSAQGVSSESLLDSGGVTQQSMLATPRSFFEDFKARNIGDIVTIKVVENISSMKVSNVDLNTQTDHDASFKFIQNMNASSTLTPDTNDRINMTMEFIFPIDYGKSRERSIGVNNQETFTTLVSALVIEVDPVNGNMVVEGSRQLLVEGQTKSLYVRGVVNPKDVDANNEVPSYKLANAQMQIIGSGSLTKERDKGIIQKIFSGIF